MRPIGLWVSINRFLVGLGQFWKSRCTISILWCKVCIFQSIFDPGLDYLRVEWSRSLYIIFCGKYLWIQHQYVKRSLINKTFYVKLVKTNHWLLKFCWVLYSICFAFSKIVIYFNNKDEEYGRSIIENILRLGLFLNLGKDCFFQNQLLSSPGATDFES